MPKLGADDGGRDPPRRHLRETAPRQACLSKELQQRRTDDHRPARDRLGRCELPSFSPQRKDLPSPPLVTDDGLVFFRLQKATSPTALVTLDVQDKSSAAATTTAPGSSSSFLFYVASRFGDSQLVRLFLDRRSDADADADADAGAEAELQLVASYPSLAPILDCCLVEDEAGGSVRLSCSRSLSIIPIDALMRPSLAGRVASSPARGPTRLVLSASSSAESVFPRWPRWRYRTCRGCGAFPKKPTMGEC